MARTLQRSDLKAKPSLGSERSLIQPDLGAVLPGVIVASDPSKDVYTVRLEHSGKAVPGCVYASGFLSALIGIKFHFRPLAGTRVLLAYGNPSYIIGSAPSERADKAGGKGRRNTTGDVKQNVKVKHLEGDNANTGATAAEDLFPGELEIGTQTGVAIQFLTFLLKLQASDRAKIECHLVDDMVRVVSETFRHHSAFGDFEISNTGGGPTVIWHGAGKTHEAWGQVKAKDPKAKKVNAKKVEPEDVAETGRWRFSQFMGYLGDFLHLILADPAEAIGQIAQARAGKFDCHVNNDGSLLVRSVAEIAFERVVVIPVPIQQLPLDDPEGNTRREIEEAVRSMGLNLDKLLKRWDYGKNNSRLHLLPFQLREYTRYLSQLHGFARMLSQNKDWLLESEADALNRQPPSWNNGEEDVAAANRGTPTNYHTYSTIRILRDGSQLFLDGYGNATVMGKYGIKHSSYLDYEVEAAQDIRFVGKNIYLMARNNVEIVATVGRLILKARTFLQMLCEWGGIHIKSDAPAATDPEFNSLKRTKDDQPEPSEDPEPVFLHDAGVLIEASHAGAIVSGGRQAILRSTGLALRDSEQNDPDSIAGSVLLLSEQQDVLLRAGRNLLGHARGDSSEPSGLVGFKGRAVSLNGVQDGVQLAGTLVDLNRGLTVRGRSVHVDNLTANKVAAVSSLAGPKRGPQEPLGKVDPHFGHVIISEDEDVQIAEVSELEAVEYLRNNQFLPIKLFPGKGPSWDFLPTSEYRPNAQQSSDDRHPWKSPTQERLAEDPILTANYMSWDWSVTNRLDSIDPATGRRHDLPHTGKDPKHQYFEHTEPLLHLPSSTAPAELGEVPQSQVEPRTLLIRKRS